MVNDKTQYTLEQNGSFVIENYNQTDPFSNFFPGIAGVWGVPMWVFYVNRGQCIASFGIENKDKAMMEFHPANKSYRQTAIQGFRTFIKATDGENTHYWEPFQEHLKGTNYSKQAKLSINAEDLTLEEVNHDLGLKVTVHYFTIAQEAYPALVRRVSVQNETDKDYKIEMVDGLPMILPYGMNDFLVKNLARTIEAWAKVRKLSEKTPYFQLNVEVSDKPEVKHIQEGNFYFSFRVKDPKHLLEPVVEAAAVFGSASGFLAPEKFLEGPFSLPAKQNTSNRTPSAMSSAQFALSKGQTEEVVSFLGHAKTEEQLDAIVKQATSDDFVLQKAYLNKKIISDIKNYALTNSASREFNQFASQTFLDNILRGGLPVSVKTSEGNMAVNVFSRKHGDLERDYNYFNLASTYFSQGNGNYRDVSQNRRNDVWFNTDVKDNHLINFLNLSQADGYNPLVVMGSTFSFDNEKEKSELLNECIKGEVPPAFLEFLEEPFMPGDLLEKVKEMDLALTVDIHDFLGMVLERCQKQEKADHGEGFWSDHWTYNLDLVESYVSLFPEKLRELLTQKKEFTFYHNAHYVLPIDQRYVLSSKGVRQYEGVAEIKDGIHPDKNGNILKTEGGAGDPYYTTLIVKILCLIANKISTLDPSGIGVAMEADKPNWYDALNGLPGLLGSAISETYEIKRFCLFLLDALDTLSLGEDEPIPVFDELSRFIKNLNSLLRKDPDALTYWVESNELKEHYREKIRFGISGVEEDLTIKDLKGFLNQVIAKVDQAIESAKDDNGYLSTYFYHEVTEYRSLKKDKKPGKAKEFVRPLKFKRHDLPSFLEGYVHALRVEKDKQAAHGLYELVRKSDLFDPKLNMYKVNADLSDESEEIGRTRIFPRGWLENESVWLHMEYKFMLELLRSGLYAEFYQNFRKVLVPFLEPKTYKRSILENSSFIVSSAHEDEHLHGQGFVARLSGSTCEFLHMWLFMNVGTQPFSLDQDGKLQLTFAPILEGDLFTQQETTMQYQTVDGELKSTTLPPSVYAFNFLGSMPVVYHNPRRVDTFGDDQPKITGIKLTYRESGETVDVQEPSIPEPYSKDIRAQKVERIDVVFE